MARTLSMLAGSRRLAVAGAAALLLLMVLTGGVARAAGSVANTTAPSISGTAQSGQTLTADPGSWSGDTSGGFGYQWQRCDTHGANCNPIAGATSSTYTAQEFGITLVVAVTALDGPTVATSAATAVVRGPNPTGGSCTLVPRTGDADSTVFNVTCESWSDYNQADPLTYSGQWWGCDGDGLNCVLEDQSIPTTVPYVEGMFSGGGVNHVTVIICEFDGSCTSWNDVAYVAGDYLPHNNPVAPPTVSGRTWLGDTLTADPGAWSNNPTSYSYQWLRCVSVLPGYHWGQRHDLLAYDDCAPIDGATATSYTVQPSDLGYAFVVEVTAANGQGQTTVAGPTTARLAGPPSAALAGLTINTGTLSPAFDAATSSYSLAVPYTTSSLALTATLDDANATVKIDGASTTSGTAVSKSLSVGVNTFTAVVTAQDGTTTRTYTVTVTRAAASQTATLAGLTVGQGTLSPAFSAGTSIYTVGVSNSVSSFTYTPTVADARATLAVKAGGGSFVPAVSGDAVTAPVSVGLTTFAVKVLAEDGVTFDIYQVRVTRAAASDATLSALAVSNASLSPAFTSVTSDYSATVPYTTSSLDLTPTTDDAAATVTLNGAAVTSGHAQSETLSVGDNTFTVTVTAQDGTTRTYTVTVTRAATPVSSPPTPLPPVAPVITPLPTLTVVIVTQTEPSPRSTRPGALPPVTAPEFSTKATVKLETAAPAGTTQVVISNNADFSNATTFPVDPNGIYAWSLAEAGAANGDRTVYLRFVLSDGVSTTLTANVKLDDKAPVVSRPHYLAKSKGSTKVSVPAADQASGVRFTQFAPNVEHPWGWTRYTAKTSVRTKQTFIYVRTADAAGNVSAWQKIAFPPRMATK